MRIACLIGLFFLVACIRVSETEAQPIQEVYTPKAIKIAAIMAPEEYRQVYFEYQERRPIHPDRSGGYYLDLPKLYGDVPVSQPALDEVELDLNLKEWFRDVPI